MAKEEVLVDISRDLSDMNRQGLDKSLFVCTKIISILRDGSNNLLHRPVHSLPTYGLRKFFRSNE